MSEQRDNRVEARHRKARQWIRRRIYIAAGVLSLLFLGIAYKAYGLQVEHADRYRTLARRQHIRTIEVPAPRGVIFDGTGRELANSAQADSVHADPHKVVDVAATAEALALALDIDVRRLEARLSSPRHFAWIKRHVTVEQAAKVRALELVGVELTQEPRRFYPNRSLAGTVIGFSGIDGRGLDGVELSMNELLVGHRGQRAALRDASGKLMLAGDELVESRPGASVTLTIDRSIQFIAERALAEAATKNEARAGSIVVLDVHSGEVLAMASWPSYDPNRPQAAPKNARNRAVTDAYEIGSVMKVFTIAAALEAGVVTPNTLFKLHKGRMRVGRKYVVDSHEDDQLSTAGIMKRSSNVGAVKIAQRTGKKRLHHMLAKFGFGRKTGIELPGERSGQLRTWKRWGDIRFATVAYGYGLTVSPLQVAAGVAAIAADGIYHEPRIVKHVMDGAKVLYQHEPVSRRVIKQRTARQLRKMMHAVFEKGRKYGGTAKSVDIRGYEAGGKTGTSHKVDPKTGMYSSKLYVSSFAGFAPLQAPRIAVVVVIDEPRGKHHYGAQVAGPAFARVVSETLRYLGVPAKPDTAPDAKSDADRNNHDHASDKAHDKRTGNGEGSAASTALPLPFMDAGERLTPGPNTVTIPDFRGMGLARALDAARDAGISLQTQGSGRVTRQDPPPGLARRPARCRLVLSPGPQ